jgi:hypothetical protein
MTDESSELLLLFSARCSQERETNRKRERERERGERHKRERHAGSRKNNFPSFLARAWTAASDIPAAQMQSPIFSRVSLKLKKELDCTT